LTYIAYKTSCNFRVIIDAAENTYRYFTENQ